MTWNMTTHRRLLLGLILVGAGGVLLIAQAFGATAEFFWPLLIVAPGAALIALALGSDTEMRKLAVPGATIAGIGLILFFQNLFNYYESWAYVWPLVPFSVGVGMWLAAEEEDGEHGTEAARHLMTWSMTVFVVLAALFELFIFDGGILAARIVVPLVLIGAGAALLLGWIGSEEHSGTGHERHEQP